MLLSIHHAAQRLDVHPDTLRRWARDGLVAVVRLPSGRLRVAEEGLERIARPDTRVDQIMRSIGL
jgi:predicted site-specific integrase-resolvase